MVLGRIFASFVEKSPVSVMVRGVMERVLSAQRLDQLFEEHAERQYTRELLFSTLFDLVCEIVCGVRRSVHAAYQASRGEIAVSVVSIYGKLARMEPTVLVAMVRETAAEMRQIIEQTGGMHEPLLVGYRVKILDGNCIQATEHRIKELRSLAAGALPGKSLVVLDPALGMAVDVFPCEDGHAQERSLLNEVLATVERGDVWIADRNFCTKDFLHGIAGKEGLFVIREHRKLSWKPLTPLTQVGHTETGVVCEQLIRLRDANGEGLILRRIQITLRTKTRDGDRRLAVVSNLPGKGVSAASAPVVADLYRRRWKIEIAFQNLERDLNSEINTLGHPPAALFCFCVALVAFNMFAVIKAALRAAHGPESAEHISGYYLADEIEGTRRGMTIAIPDKHWLVFGRMSTAKLAEALVQLALLMNLSAFQKHPRGQKKPPPKRLYDPKHPHVSTARLLNQRKLSRVTP
jgi:hypothetical protein